MRKVFHRLNSAAFIAFSIYGLGVVLPALRGDDWEPITPEELALKDDPANPGAPAIRLYQEDHTDDKRDFSRQYHRIKILKEDGLKYADIEIPFLKGMIIVHDIKARTIQPDGRIQEFKGEIYEKPYLKSRRRGILAKTFTLAGVQVGSIIEYRYRNSWDRTRLFHSRWIIQGELSVRRAKFHLIPYSGRPLAWVFFGIPRGKDLKQRDDRSIQLQMENIAALPEEEFMPPPESLKARVLFFYLDDDLVGRDIRGPETYWKAVGKQYYENDDNFIGNRKEIQRVAQETVGSNDPPEAKLAKLYARAQQIRNTSFERSKTEKEQKKEKIKENMNAGEVLKHGYGGGSDINLFFTALARAAGFEATIAYLTARRDGYFEPNMLSDSQFDASIVQVRQGNQTWHLDPATKFCPFNLLPWEETWSRGILPNKDGYTNITTPEPKVADAVIERKAAFRLDEEGTLGGAVRIVFIGQEALDRRLGNRDQDEKGRRKAAEDEVKGWLPAGAAVELTNSPAWEQSDNQLEAEFKVTIPQYATATGRRILLPLSVFQAKEKYPFRATRRVHPIYLDHPFQQQDEVTAELPPGFEVETLPAPRNKEFPALRYEIARTHQARTLKLTRTLAVQKHMFDVQSYSALRVFYDNVRAGDEEQIVLKAVDSEPPK